MWYPGDMELYYAMKQNFSRVERGYGWPAFWKSEGFRNPVVFRRTYTIPEETTFVVLSKAVGYVGVGDKKYPFGKEVTCGPGNVCITIHAARIDAFPSVYVEGEIILSDGGWMAEDYAAPPVPVGISPAFTKPDQDTAEWEYTERCVAPSTVEETEGGLLFGFDTELTAVLKLNFLSQTETEKLKNGSEVTVCCGESREEALDTVHCYYSWTPDENGCCPRSALRYAFLPGFHKGEVELTALHQFVDIPTVAAFHSDDELLNRIWATAEHTFKLCSGIFFLDGVKRDKWIWSGDAYQSLFVNQYLTADREIEERTLTALRGNDPMTGHINTIIDYSLLWLLGVKAHVDAYGAEEYLRRMYPKLKTLMEFVEGRTEEHGFVIGREGDWTFIDWADFDKDGPFCPEQMLLAQCYTAMAEISDILGEDSGAWREKRERLLSAIEQFFWDEARGVYIDSFTSGKKNVTRHATIFAILFDLADETRKQRLLSTVLQNDSVPPITTPYFKLYELEALCKSGCLEQVLEEIRSYWGGMLELGATTFWEEYDPKAPRETMYDMYGDKFGKSLCHAWSASPIYLLERYFLGVRPLSPGYRTFEVRPQTRFFKKLDCTVPVNTGTVRIQWDGDSLYVTPSEGCGELVRN